jgi:hypothetical protein
MTPPGEFFHLTWREHISHCMYLILRQQAVEARGGRKDEQIADIEHQAHCAWLPLEHLGGSDEKLDSVGGSQHVGFLSC